MSRSFPLEKLGLLRMLERIDQGARVIDSMVGHGLIKEGLIQAGEQLELTDEGRRMVAALREARAELETALAGASEQETERAAE